MSLAVAEQLQHRVMRTDYFRVPLPNGLVLGAKLWLPTEAEHTPMPALVDYHPYRGCDFTAAADERIYARLAMDGFACVKLDARGTGNSGGLHLDQFAENYWTDAAAAIEWIAKQPWCNGRVGMMGLSWPAHASLMVATEQPSALKAIMPVNAADDRYLNRYQGGCLLLYTVWWGAILGAMQARPPLPWVVGDGWRDVWLERLEAFRNFFESWAAHPTFDSYWHAGSASIDLSRIRCPVFTVAGWADPGYAVNVPRLLQGLDVPRRGLIGPWGHCFPQEALPGPSIDFHKLTCQWFGRWLKEGEGGTGADPMLAAWIIEGGRPDANGSVRPGYWVVEDAWPSRHVENRRFGFAPGRIGPSEVSRESCVVRTPLTVGAAAGEWMPWYPTGPGPHLAEDQRSDDANSLTFDGEPLQEPLELLGIPELHLEVSSDRPAGQIVVRLCDVAPDGVSSRITYGFLNLSHREGDVEALAVTPGQRYRIKLTLYPIGWCVAPTHRLRIAVSTSYWPIIWPLPEKAKLTLHLAGCGLSLPVRKGPPGVADLFGHPPGNVPQLALDQSVAPRMCRVRTWDVGTRELIASVEEDCGTTILRDAGLELKSSTLRRYTIRADNPLSARCDARAEWSLRRDGWNATVRVDSTVTADVRQFAIQTKIVGVTSDREIYTRTDHKNVERGSA